MVGREDIERMKRVLEELLEEITENKALNDNLESVHQKVAGLDERVRTIETLLETVVKLIQELILISSGEATAVEEEQAVVKQGKEEERYELKEQPQKVNMVESREGEEAVRVSSWDILGQRPKVSLHDLERELERLFSRMAELEVAREEKRLTESEYQKVMDALGEKKERIVRDLERLFNSTQK